MSKKQRRQGQKRRQHHRKKKEPMLFSRQNYKIMLIGIGLIILGFSGMAIENAIHGIYSLYFAPLMIIGGFGIIAYGIMKTDPEQDLNQQEASQSK